MQLRLHFYFTAVRICGGMIMTETNEIKEYNPRTVMQEAERNAGLYLWLHESSTIHKLYLSTMKSRSGRICACIIDRTDQKHTMTLIRPEGIMHNGIIRFADIIRLCGLSGCSYGSTMRGMHAGEDSYLYLDDNTFYLIPKMHSFRSLGGSVIPVVPDTMQPCTREELIDSRSIYTAVAVKFQGTWKGIRISRHENTCSLYMNLDGETEQLDIASDDREAAAALKARFTDLRAALFQVRVGGRWYWMDRCYGKSAEDMGCSVFGGEPVPELEINHPGPYEEEWNADAKHIEDVRMLLSNPLMESFFDI